MSASRHIEADGVKMLVDRASSFAASVQVRAHIAKTGQRTRSGDAHTAPATSKTAGQRPFSSEEGLCAFGLCVHFCGQELPRTLIEGAPVGEMQRDTPGSAAQWGRRVQSVRRSLQAPSPEDLRPAGPAPFRRSALTCVRRSGPVSYLQLGCQRGPLLSGAAEIPATRDLRR